MKSNDQPPKSKLPSLNGLRAISISMVIVSHLQQRFAIFSWAFKKGANKVLMPFISVLGDGRLGVNVFFVISGFLICTLLLQEEAAKSRVSLKSFYIRRTLRIFPAYYFYLLTLFVLQLLGVIYISGAAWLTSLTYTKYFNWTQSLITAHAWSLSVEEHFYLFWPLLFMLGDKIRKTSAVVLILIVPIIKIVTFYYPVQWINDFTIFLRIDAIALGCFIALYREEILKVLSRNFRLLFYLSLLGIVLLRYLQPLSDKLNNNLDFITVPFGSSSGTIANLFIGIVLLYSIFGHRGIWFRLLNSKVLNYIGMISYSLYLWQQIFLTEIDCWITSYPQNILFIFATAILSYYLIETPFLKLRDKFQMKSPSDVPLLKGSAVDVLAKQ